MSTFAPAAPQPYPPSRAIALVSLTLALGYVVILVGAVIAGQWLIDTQGRPIASDFVNVWAAGRLALDGHPTLAYDWIVHKSMEVRAVGHAFENYYGWHYPPPFLFVACALALVPILPATFLWLAATLPLYLAAVRAIVGERAGYLFALGFPAVAWNVTASQNGFLTAALVGGTLTFLERQPVIAGICLGLLSYKPHFGLLFPLALIATRQWRVLVIAGATAAAMTLASLIVFGADTWLAFFQSMPKVSEAVLGEGRADWDRLQSLFGLVRAHGGSEVAAWAVQLAAFVVLAAAIYRLWRSEAAFALKAAALACAALIATPYLYIYDFVVLAIPAGYLIRLGLARGITLAELVGLPAATLLLLIYPYVKTQTGLAAAVIVGALIVLRLVAQHPREAALTE